MSAIPMWTDSGQGDLLSLVAQGSPATPTADEEWQVYVAALKSCRDDAGLISPNLLRPMVRGKIAPRRISAFANAALAAHLVEHTGEWEISDDREGRNSGKPCRTFRWIGGAS